MSVERMRNVGFSIKRTASMIHFSFNNFLKPYGIAAEQFTLMRLVKETPEISQKEIADYLAKNKATVTKMLSVLEKKGLITKEHLLGDRRSYRISITQKGKSLFDEVAEVLYPKLEAFNSQFTDNELEVFHTVIDKCQEFIRKDLS